VRGHIYFISRPVLSNLGTAFKVLYFTCDRLLTWRAVDHRNSHDGYCIIIHTIVVHPNRSIIKMLQFCFSILVANNYSIQNISCCLEVSSARLVSFGPCTTQMFVTLQGQGTVLYSISRSPDRVMVPVVCVPQIIRLWSSAYHNDSEP